MIYISDLQQLLNSWMNKRDTYPFTSPYRDALCDCIYELSDFISRNIDDQLSYQDLIDSEADEYLSSMDNYYATAI